MSCADDDGWEKRRKEWRRGKKAERNWILERGVKVWMEKVLIYKEEHLIKRRKHDDDGELGHGVS